MQPVLTVGLDGSPESLAAARWAADEAEKRGLTLRLLHAWPLLATEPTGVPSEVDQNYWAKRLVHTARAELQARHPGLTVVESLVADDAENALLQAASESEMIVLGSRGWSSSRVTSWVTSAWPSWGGPNGRWCWSAPKPRRRGGPSTREPRGRGPETARVLRGPARLRLPQCCGQGRSSPGRPRPKRAAPRSCALGVDHDVTEEMTRDAEAQLSAALRPWSEKYPQVDVAESIRLASPAKAVVQAADGAALLVVGRREHRRGMAPHLGPVAQAAIHHGRCPVAVVPHG